MPRPVACFWTGSALSWLEHLSIRSHQAHGNEVVLYTSGEVGNIPTDVTQRSAQAICPAPFDISDGARKPVAVYSDLLRLAILGETAAIWCDMDAITVAPLGDEELLVGTGPDGALTGVLALPPASPVLAAMQAFVTSPNPQPPWKSKAPSGTRTILDLPWGATGPKALDHFLRALGGSDMILPEPVFYPLFKRTLARLHQPGVPDTQIVQPGTRSVHVFGFNRIWLALAHRGLPVPGSWLDRRCRHHQINPQDAPIDVQPWMWQTPVGRDIQRQRAGA